MDTNKVYLGRIYEVESIVDGYYEKKVQLTHVDDAIMILKRDIFGQKYMKDLNNGKKYKVKLPTKVGVLYVSRTYLKSFNKTLNNETRNLSKKKILELGNKYINSKEM